MNHTPSLLIGPVVHAILLYLRRWLTGELRGNLGIDPDSLTWMIALIVTTVAGLRACLEHNLHSHDETALTRD